jgi:hypothetical protein
MILYLTYLFILICVLAYVFYIPEKLQSGPEKTRLAYLRERRDVVYENLRDLNFEFKAGKFPDSDYQSMKSSLEDEAAAILAEMASIEGDAFVLSNRKKGVRA